jgi:mono/diheme cytochrome c family protein
MKRWIIVVMGLVGILGAAAVELLAQDAARVARGQQLFAEQKCTLCHSVGAVGNKKGPLDEVGAKLKADQIKRWITAPKEMTTETKATRKPPMKAFPNLAPQDVEALVAYLQTLKKG